MSSRLSGPPSHQNRAPKRSSPDQTTQIQQSEPPKHFKRNTERLAPFRGVVGF